MKFRVKDMDISTGGILVALLNEKTAKLLDLRRGDRIKIKHNRKEIVAILDVAENNHIVNNSQVGLFEESLKKLNVKKNFEVKLSFAGKPESVKYIRKKLTGKKLSYKEFYHIMDDITHDRLTDIEKTYFVAGCYTNGLTNKEVVDLTKAVVDTGDKIKFKGLTLDKHCIGGVPNNRTTMIVIPIITALGYTMPKTSSRAITSPAGTADTMECLAKVELSQKEIINVVKKCGGCMAHGGSMNLAPADDKIIKIEHPLSIDAEGQLLASVMAKKYSVSANYVLIDIPMGKSTKAKTKSQASKLEKKFVSLGKSLGMKVKVIVTDGSQPIGNGIGPLLEVEDVMKVLSNDCSAPRDLRKKALSMSGVLLEMIGKAKKGKGYQMAKEVLEDGRALQQMEKIIATQGPVKKPKLGKFKRDFISSKPGKVKEIDNVIISKLSHYAGAPVDKGAGMYLYKKVGDKIKKGDKLFTIYAVSKTKLKLAIDELKKNGPYLIK